MKDKGFTLVEVIVSISILGILAVTFIPLLSNQYLVIMKSGKKSEATYKAVDEIEKTLVEIDKEDEYVTKESNKTEIDIKFIHLDELDVRLKVDHIEKEVEYGNKNIRISLGIPIKKPAQSKKDE